jgi:hypothetical protein
MAGDAWDDRESMEEAVLIHISTVGPANQNGCIILCADNLADEKF